MKEHRLSAGESLTETLVAMLIVALAAVVMFTMTNTGRQLLENAKEGYTQVYEEISLVECHDEASSNDTVIIQYNGTKENVPVIGYTGGDLYSYELGANP